MFTPTPQQGHGGMMANRIGQPGIQQNQQNQQQNQQNQPHHHNAQQTQPLTIGGAIPQQLSHLPSLEIKEVCLQEAKVGASWWGDQLTDVVPQAKITIFRNTLQEAIIQKYRGHWDPTNTIRGSGYRAITADTHRLDPLLVKACQAAEVPLEDFCRCVFKRGSDYTMFINPGEVRIRNGALLTTSSTQLWTSNPQQATGHHSSTTPVTGTPNGLAGGPNPSLIPSRGALFTPSHHSYTPTGNQSMHSGGHNSHHHHHHGYGSMGSHQGHQQQHLGRSSIHAAAWVPSESSHYHDYERGQSRRQK